jgi:hypothetical protein
MSRIKFWSICLFAVSALSGPAFGEDIIEVNHFKEFRGGGPDDEHLKLDLVTPKKTRILILVTKGPQLLEQHRVVAGPD